MTFSNNEVIINSLQNLETLKEKVDKLTKTYEEEKKMYGEEKNKLRSRL